MDAGVELTPGQWSRTRRPVKVTAWEAAKEISSVERSNCTTLNETAVILVMEIFSVFLDFFPSTSVNTPSHLV